MREIPTNYADGRPVSVFYEDQGVIDGFYVTLFVVEGVKYRSRCKVITRTPRNDGARRDKVDRETLEPLGFVWANVLHDHHEMLKRTEPERFRRSFPELAA